jgi:hypothetical protein
MKDGHDTVSRIHKRLGDKTSEGRKVQTTTTWPTRTVHNVYPHGHQTNLGHSVKQGDQENGN